MRTLLALVAFLLVAGCSANSPSAQDEPSAATRATPLQCAVDTACKGDRICVNGMCQEPTKVTPASHPKTSSESSRTETTYSGTPSKDFHFADFVDSNLGNIIAIDVVTTDEDSDSMPEGYRGGNPSFMGKPVGAANRQFVIDCQGYGDFPSVDNCGKMITWDGGSRRLRGSFRVSGVEKFPQVWVYTFSPETP
jgi:hypothetical protein